MGRPSYRWTDEQIVMLKDGWDKGLSIEAISSEIGASYSGTRRKIKDLGLEREEIRTIAIGKGADSSWDEWLFETWAERKARLARERTK